MFLFLYNLFFPFVLLLSLPFYLRRMLKRGGYARNFLQRFGFFSKRLKRRFREGGWSWVRAVSVGEMMMALRLLTELKRQNPTFKAVISTTTSTGYAVGRQRTFEQPWIEVIYSPIDFYPIVHSIWRKIQPKEVILIDSDLWPSFFAAAAKHKTRVFLANARLSSRSEKRFRKTNFFARVFFWNQIEKLFAQDQVDVERWAQVGVSPERIEVTGSMKYDVDDAASPNKSQFIEWLRTHGINGDRKILLGGSLHPGEEELLINCYRLVREHFSELFLILVPRHAERTPEIEELLRNENIGYTLRSSPVFDHDPSVLIVNSTGELHEWYHTADVVVIGKSFYGIGGQNPVEPIAAHKPVIVGPHMENFSYLIQELQRTGGILLLDSPAKLPGAVIQLLSDPQAASCLVTGADQALAVHLGSIRRTAGSILARRQLK
jgi:3-deoxy-D-manno-octulosonic-acid transferase